MKDSAYISQYLSIITCGCVLMKLPTRGRFRGSTRPGPPPIFTCKKIFRALYLTLCQYLLKISSCIDLKCLLYVWATVKIQFANTILNHAHPPLGRYAFSRVRAPLCENSGSTPAYIRF